MVGFCECRSVQAPFEVEWTQTLEIRKYSIRIRFICTGVLKMVEQSILDSFHTMWGAFPEPVMLIHKSRTILAVNDIARAIGIAAGIKCFSLNPETGDHYCDRCEANLAVETCKTVCSEISIDGKRIIGYWMPLKEAPDVYVHFGIGTVEAMAAVRSRAFE